jgi:hypothetical protein
MIYRVPCPTTTNGVRLLKEGHQILVEYQKGAEPHVGGMAYDSALGTHTRTVTIRPKRPDFDRIIADAKRKALAYDMLPRAGKPPIVDDDNDADNTDAEEIVRNLLSYLEDKLTPQQLEDVTMILSSGDGSDLDTSGAPARQSQATDHRAAVAAQRRRLAADRGRYGMSDATEREVLAMFPDWNRLS